MKKKTIEPKSETALRKGIRKLIGVLILATCLFPVSTIADTSLSQPAHPLTVIANQTASKSLNFEDRQDFEDSYKGFIGTWENLVIKDSSGQVVWDMPAYDFLTGDPADTVNPSLWRQEQLNNIHGLFKIHDRIYQVRNFDLSVMTFIQGDTGWIVIDPLVSKETARAALELADKHLGKRPVKAVVYTHTHADHFGGVRGIVDEKDVVSGRIRIIAPEHFMNYAIAENVLAGNAMTRRAYYQFGGVIEPGPRGRVGTGLGKTFSMGTIGLIPPTDSIGITGEKRTVDGVRMVFQMASGSEAPSEFIIYFPDYRALCLAEVTSHHMHNLYTLRGAQVRDALGWSKYINETISLFAEKTDLAFGCHHWPTWGKEGIKDFLVKQRDLYRYIHDETLRFANMGLTPKEIAEIMQLPPSLEKEFSVRGYYGTLSHNIKAVYQYYLGWYDGNPANLNPLPPVEAGKRYVEFMGGADALLKNAQQYYDAGEFRWVAEVVNHLVFADPGNTDARQLQANALEQMGYQAESGVWRNAYLAGAAELRHGVQPVRSTTTAGPDVMRAMTLDMIFDFLGVRLKKDKVAGLNLNINMEFTNIKTNYALELSNGVLNNTKGRILKNADATYRLDIQTFAKLLGQKATFAHLLESGEIVTEGNAKALGMIMVNLEKFNPLFNIVTP